MERVLSYGDVLLRRRDVQLLEGDHFLNDQIIEFFFAYLSRQQRDQRRILMVSPSIAFLIANCPDASSKELEATVGVPLDMARRPMVLLPVNDNADVDDAGGGSHWSLLVYHRASNAFLHFDSAAGANESCAERLAQRAAPLLGPNALEASFQPAPGSPQQMNWFDCGVYVMATAKVLSELGGGGRDAGAAAVRRQVTPQMVTEMRHSTVELIRSLATAAAAAAAAE